MARRTFESMQALIMTTRTGNRNDVTDEMVEQWLNDALKRIANEFVLPELQGETTETLGLGSDRITPVTSDIWWPDAVKNDTDGPFILNRSKQEVDHQRTKRSSAPSRYYWWAGKFVFDTLANTAKTVRIWYVKNPGYWTTGESVLDSLYDGLIEDYATMRGLQVLRDYKAAHLVEVQTNNWLSRQNLPVRQAKLDDYRQGVQVRRD